jgi:hypothetical protein
VSVVRKFKVPNKLAQQMFGRGGKMVKDAIADSEAAVAELREEGLVVLDALLAGIMAAYGPDVAEPEPDLEALYIKASAVIDVAGFLPDSGLAEACVSLCDLVDACQEAGVTDWPSVRVHLDALNLLRKQGEKLGPTGRETVLEGLRKLSRRRLGG